MNIWTRKSAESYETGWTSEPEVIISSYGRSSRKIHVISKNKLQIQLRTGMMLDVNL